MPLSNGTAETWAPAKLPDDFNSVIVCGAGIIAIHKEAMPEYEKAPDDAFSPGEGTRTSYAGCLVGDTFCRRRNKAVFYQIIGNSVIHCHFQQNGRSRQYTHVISVPRVADDI